MTAIPDDGGEAPAKKSKLPLILGLVLALVGAGGSFFAVSSGMLFGGSDSKEEKADGAAEAGSESDDKRAESIATAAFVPLEPILVSIPDVGGTRFLKFTAQLEVEAGTEAQVANLIPRIVDVMNDYLRAFTVDELSDPNILTRLRSQMVRRIQIVTGPGQVRDLLIMEFVLN